MRGPGTRGWIGGLLLAAGAVFLVAAIVIGSGWNIVVGAAIMFSGALTLEIAWSLRRRARVREQVDVPKPGQ